MIFIILLSCLSLMVTAVPVSPSVLPLQQSQGGATQRLQPATNQNPEVQEPAPLSPNLEQQQQIVTPQQQQQQQQQLDLQSNPQLSPSLQHYTWSPPGGSALIIPLQPSIHGPQHANQLTLPQQPPMFPPYGYLPVFSSPYSNQLFSPYGFPLMFEPPRLQAPASQLPNSPVLPAENTAGAVAAAGNTLQPQQQQQQQQQQNSPVVYMLQQPMSNTLGGLSSEELEMAAKMSQLGVYTPGVLTNMPAGASQPESRATGLANPQQQGAAGIMEASAAGGAGASQPCSGSQPNAKSVPAGLEKAASEAATVQTPVQAKL